MTYLSRDGFARVGGSDGAWVQVTIDAKDPHVVRVDGRLAFASAAAASNPEGPVDPDQLDSEVERLRGLGAELVTFKTQNDERWANMLDPEGNEFCLQ